MAVIIILLLVGGVVGELYIFTSYIIIASVLYTCISVFYALFMLQFLQFIADAEKAERESVVGGIQAVNAQMEKM